MFTSSSLFTTFFNKHLMMDHRDQNMLAYSNIRYTVLFDNNLTVPTLFKNVIINTVQLFVVLFPFHNIMEITAVKHKCSIQ